MKSSLSLSFSHTLSPFLTLASLSLSPFFSLSLREGLRRWSVRRGEDFTRRWGDGKTSPSNVSHRSQRGPDPKATSNLTLSFDLLSPLLTGNSATPCSLFKPLWVCVCVWFSDRAKPPLSRNVDTWADTGALKCCWGVKTLFTDWISLCHVVARCPLHTFSCDFFQCWRDSIEHKSAEAVDLFKVYWHLVWFSPPFLRKCFVSALSVVLMVFPLKEYWRRRREKRRGVMGLSGDCLFAVFTAKPLRTYRHFHQHSAVHNTHLPACVRSASNVLFHSHTLLCVSEKLYMTPLSPRGHLCLSVRPDYHLLVAAHHYTFTWKRSYTRHHLFELPFRVSLWGGIVLKMHKSQIVALVFRRPVSFDDCKLDGRYQPPCDSRLKQKPWANSMYDFIKNLS